MSNLKNFFVVLRTLMIAAVVVTVASCDSDGDAELLGNLVAIADGDFTRIEISGVASEVIEVGATVNLTVQAFSDGSTSGTPVSSALWSSSNNSIATVTNSGVVTGGNTTGEVTITANFGNLTDFVTLNVSSAPLTGIVVTAATGTVNECGSLQFTAEGVFEGEDQTRPLLDNIVWSVDQPTASFSDEDFGLLQVTNQGSLVVTASRGLVTSEESSVSVVDILTAITIRPEAGSSPLVVGSSVQYQALGTYAMAEGTFDITENVEWDIPESAASGNFAAVDTSGLVTASGAGDGILTADCANATGSIPVMAEGSGQLANLVVTGPNPENDPFTVQFTGQAFDVQLSADAVFRDSVGSVDVTEDSFWTVPPGTTLFFISNEAGDRGLLTVMGEGTVTVTATFVDEDNNDAILQDTLQITSQ